MRKTSLCRSLVALVLAIVAAAGMRPEDMILARGFKPNSVFSVGEFNSVNTFNGNLMLNIPLGQEYRTNGPLKYRFILHYDSHAWDLYSYEGGSQTSATATGNAFFNALYAKNFAREAYDWSSDSPVIIFPVTARSPGELKTDARVPQPLFPGFFGVESVAHGNAGMGWTLSLGELQGFRTPITSNVLSYVSPTGTISRFAGLFCMAMATSSIPIVCSIRPMARISVCASSNRRRRRTAIWRKSIFRTAPGSDSDVSPIVPTVPIRAGCSIGSAILTAEVVRIKYTDAATSDQPANGVPSLAGQPPGAVPGGVWKWEIIEGTASIGESGAAAQYYSGSEDLKTIRTHYAYFRAKHQREVRLERLAVAAPHGKLAVYDFLYESVDIPSEPGPVWQIGGAGLLIPYEVRNIVIDAATGQRGDVALRGVSQLIAVRLPDPAGASAPPAVPASTDGCASCTATASACSLPSGDAEACGSFVITTIGHSRGPFSRILQGSTIRRNATPAGCASRRHPPAAGTGSSTESAAIRCCAVMAKIS